MILYNADCDALCPEKETMMPFDGISPEEELINRIQAVIRAGWCRRMYYTPGHTKHCVLGATFHAGINNSFTNSAVQRVVGAIRAELRARGHSESIATYNDDIARDETDIIEVLEAARGRLSTAA